MHRIEGHSVRHSASNGATNQAPAAPSTTPSTIGVGPTLLTIGQAARVLGVSERRFHQLRDEAWMPRPVALSSKVIRWVRAELEAAVVAAPRQSKQAEPVTLAEGRRRRIEAMKAAGKPATEGGAA